LLFPEIEPYDHGLLDVGDPSTREALVEATNRFSRRTGEGASLPNP
jgi:hypothetical protein